MHVSTLQILESSTQLGILSPKAAMGNTQKCEIPLPSLLLLWHTHLLCISKCHELNS